VKNGCREIGPLRAWRVPGRW